MWRLGVHLPSNGGGPWPAVLFLDRDRARVQLVAGTLTARGYAAVCPFTSEGEAATDPPAARPSRGSCDRGADSSARPAAQGATGWGPVAIARAVEWTVRQPWCSGRLGLHLAAPGDGARLPAATGVHGLAGLSLDLTQEAGGGKPGAPALQPAASQVPALVLGSATGGGCAAAVGAFAALTADLPGGAEARVHRLVLGPWPCVPAGELAELLLWWWDQRLKGKEAELDEPDLPVRYYVMGANEWRACCKWPPGGVVHVPRFLHVAEAQDGAPAGSEGWLREMPAAPGAPPLRLAGGSGAAASFCTPPLPAPLEVSGPATLLLPVDQAPKDATLQATLLDVTPDGHAVPVYSGGLTLCSADSPPQHRAGQAHGQLAEVDLGHASWAFLAGHRLRLEIRCDSRFVAAEAFGLSIACDARRPSRLILPVAADSG